MDEEKSMIEYKEPKGPFQWLKTQFEKMKQLFRGKKDEEPQKIVEEGELSVEELDKVTAGNPLNVRVASKEELLADLGVKEEDIKKEPKPWDLTPEQLKIANERIPEQDQTDEQEMSVEELDKITAGQPVVEEEEER